MSARRPETLHAAALNEVDRRGLTMRGRCRRCTSCYVGFDPCRCGLDRRSIGFDRRSVGFDLQERYLDPRNIVVTR
jgi:hypothetical protein